MISVEEARGILEKRFPDAIVKSSYMYKDSYYLFYAPDKNVGDVDYNDPFYIVSVDGSKTRFLNPLEDFEAFRTAINENHIKSYTKEGDGNG